MKSIKKIIKILSLIITLTLLFSCEDDCTKTVNIPKYDHNQMEFIDNYEEVPCDFEEPVVDPVNDPI
ncbi:hypothetical protein [Tenacibaculum retecalamus]|uniref:hypothetical protein n=1 Tax=Tenacibaculum retecalamus TaxID=3018315 RepID=UPI0023D96B38|nr:hypothetical protein [Tenacibaculum retecalamus]WBX70929.1 hypothetical protein PG912_11995 [Tenacibaculum retecalamus]